MEFSHNCARKHLFNITVDNRAEKLFGTFSKYSIKQFVTLSPVLIIFCASVIKDDSNIGNEPNTACIKLK